MKVPVVLMDTPYRFRALLADLMETHGNAKCILGIDLTQPTERIYDGPLSRLKVSELPEKAEFILILHS